MIVLSVCVVHKVPSVSRCCIGFDQFIKYLIYVTSAFFGVCQDFESMVIISQF